MQQLLHCEVCTADIVLSCKQGHLNQEEAGYCYIVDIVMEVLAITVWSKSASELCRAINAAGLQKQTPRYVD